MSRQAITSSRSAGPHVRFDKLTAMPHPVLKRIRRALISNVWWNFLYQRSLWDRYADTWTPKRVTVENSVVRGADQEKYLTHLGDEWGRKHDVQHIVDAFIYPYVCPDSIVADIGVGGGRIASRVAGRVRALYCFDISRHMLRRARTTLAGVPQVHFVLLKTPGLPDAFAEMFHFVYAFDVFVHFDVQMMWRYLNEIWKVLRPGGRAFLHTSNLTTPEGWKRFAAQEGRLAEPNCIVSPELVDFLLAKSRFRILKVSSIDPSNSYLNRDYLVIVEKPPRAQSRDAQKNRCT